MAEETSLRLCVLIVARPALEMEGGGTWIIGQGANPIPHTYPEHSPNPICLTLKWRSSYDVVKKK